MARTNTRQIPWCVLFYRPAIRYSNRTYHRYKINRLPSRPWGNIIVLSVYVVSCEYIYIYIMCV